MAANRFGIDVGEILRTESQLEGARSRNVLSRFQLGEAKKRSLRLDAERKTQAETRKLLPGLRERSVRGDESAQRELITLDPQNGPGFLDFLEKADDKKKAQAKANIEEMGKMSRFVLSGKTPEEQTRRYNLMRQNVSPETQKSLPDSFNRDFMELSMAKAGIMMKLVDKKSTRKVLKFGKEDLMIKDGEIVDRVKTALKKTGKKGGRDFKSSDSSEIRRIVGDREGGLFDEMGNLKVLDPELRGKVLDIMERASLIFAKSGELTHAEAVARAYKDIDKNKPVSDDQQIIVPEDAWRPSPKNPLSNREVRDRTTDTPMAPRDSLGILGFMKRQ